MHFRYLTPPRLTHSYFLGTFGTKQEASSMYRIVTERYNKVKSRPYRLLTHTCVPCCAHLIEFRLTKY